MQRVLIGAVLASFAVWLMAGCGGSDDLTQDGSTLASPEPFAPAAPLAIEERIVPDGLGGVPPDGPPTVASTVVEFVEATDTGTPKQDRRDLVAAGFKGGLIRSYGDENTGSFGLPGAAELGSPEQASAYAATLADDFASDLNAVRGTLDGVPGSTTWRGSAHVDGETFEFASAVFTEGSFVYAMFAGGSQQHVDSDELLQQAHELYEFVRDRPSP